MKTNNFKKRIWVIMVFALLLGLQTKAQNTKEWSIIPFTRIGLMLDGTIWMDETYHVDAGVDAKVSFNEHWSLLTGLEYDYRWGFNREGSWMFPGDHREGLQHFIRIPVRAEFTHKWFYADAGLFVERATNTHYNANKTMDFGIGSEVELGGRIRLSENDHLRIGGQVQLGAPTHWTEGGQTHSWGGGFFGYLLTLGFEHKIKADSLSR